MQASSSAASPNCTFSDSHIITPCDASYNFIFLGNPNPLLYGNKSKKKFIEKEIENLNKADPYSDASLIRETFHLLNDIFSSNSLWLSKIEEIQRLCMNLKMKRMLVKFILNFKISWYSYKKVAKVFQYKISDEKNFEVEIVAKIKAMSKENPDWDKLLLSAIVAGQAEGEVIEKLFQKSDTHPDLKEVLLFLSK